MEGEAQERPPPPPPAPPPDPTCAELKRRVAWEAGWGGTSHPPCVGGPGVRTGCPAARLGGDLVGEGLAGEAGADDWSLTPKGGAWHLLWQRG